MKKKLQITIAQPCHENWDAMSATEKGKFCLACSKQVIDFSNMSDRQLADFLKKPSTGSVCGRFMTDQLHRDIEIPRKRSPWLKYFFQMALPALFLSKASGQQTRTATAPAGRDTTINNITDMHRTMGIVATDIRPFERDTVKKEDLITISKQVTGKVVDEKGQPVANAIIRAGKTANIFITDEKGEFRILESALAGNGVLYVSSTGFESGEFTANIKDGLFTLQLKASAGESDDMTSSAQKVVSSGIKSRGIDDTPRPDAEFASDLVVQRDIQVPNDLNKFYIYPNPVSSGGTVTLGVHLLEEGYYTCRFYDNAGKLILEKEVWIDAKARLLNIEAPVTAAGSYQFTITNKKTGKKYSENISIK